MLAGKDVQQTVVDFARHNHVTQIFVARSRRRLVKRLLGKDYGEAIVRSTHDLQVTDVVTVLGGKDFSRSANTAGLNIEPFSQKLKEA